MNPLEEPLKELFQTDGRSCLLDTTNLYILLLLEDGQLSKGYGELKLEPPVLDLQVCSTQPGLVKDHTDI